MELQVKKDTADTLVERSTLVEKVVAALIDYVSASNLIAGSKLPTEVKLAGMFGVSRLALREALNRLKALGIVEARHGAGWYLRRFEPADTFRLLSPLLRNFSGADLDQMMEMRMILEPVIACMATRSRSEEGLLALNQSLEAMAGTVEDRKAFIDNDMAFHATLAQESGNKILTALAAILTDISRSAQWAFRDAIADRRRSLEYHREISAAVAKRDEEWAEMAMKAHIRDVWDRAEK
jgi:GntR family transcriptional regulator, transcriptional repressor for pyruvate dehydrogenase complex